MRDFVLLSPSAVWPPGVCVARATRDRGRSGRSNSCASRGGDGVRRARLLQPGRETGERDRERGVGLRKMGGSESNKSVFITTVAPPNKGHYGSTVFERSSLSRRSNNTLK